VVSDGSNIQVSRLSRIVGYTGLVAGS
jgi:hypothetical protein